MMKRALKWTTMIVACLFHIAPLYASLDTKCPCEITDLVQKFYVTADQIQLKDNKIYILIDNVTYETPAIFSDKDGYYIEQVAKSGGCAWYQWECSRCRWCNMRGVDWECRACQFPISH